MARTLILGNEDNLPTAVGSATSLSSATVVRVANVSGSDATLSQNPSVGSATTFTITIPNGRVEYIEKKPTDVLYATGTIRAAKVGFTG